MNRLIVPNYHPILIHFPLALLGVGLLIELFACCRRRESSLVSAGRWMILLGTLTLLPTVTTGIFALRDVAGHGTDNAHWSDVRGNIPPADWALIRSHVILCGVGAGIALISVVLWLGACSPNRRRMRIPCLILLVAAMGFLTAGAWMGGEMVFRHGIAVQGEYGVLPSPPQEPQTWRDKVDAYVSPVQLHVLLAGIAIALAAASLGVSSRKAALLRDADAQRYLPPPPALTGPIVAEYDVRPIDPLPPRPYPPGPAIVVVPEELPAASRLWLWTTLLAFLTILVGLYIGDYYAWPTIVKWHDATEAIQEIHWPHDTGKAAWNVGNFIPDSGREGLHIIGGLCILILPLLMAGAARFAPRQRAMIWIMGLLLLLIIVIQVWVGILLLYDSPQGPLGGFMPAG